MNTEDAIEITGADLVEAVQIAYELSNPQGLGYLHYTDEPLSQAEAESLIDRDARFPVNLDYVKGRALKFTVIRDEDDRLFIRNSWFDHTTAQLNALLKRIGITQQEAASA